MIVRNFDQHSAMTIPPTAHTLPGFRQWAMSEDFPQRGRVSLIDGGVLIDMNPERLESHNKPKKELFRVLETLTRQLDLGNFYVDGAWLTNDQADLSTEPEAVFAYWETLRSGRVTIVPSAGEDDDGIEIQGSPDWVLEVVSPSSVRKDTQRLLRAYHAAQISEYWLVDARGDEIQFTIFTWRQDGYEAVAPNDGWRQSAVFGRQFQLDRRRDQIGGWQYTLHIREEKQAAP